MTRFRACYTILNRPGPWVRTPWWMFWRLRWRRYGAWIPRATATGVNFRKAYEYASDADMVVSVVMED